MIRPDFTIVDYIGNVGRFIAWPNNGHTINMLEAFPKGVQEDLRFAVNQVLKSKIALKSRPIRTEYEGIFREFRLQVHPINLDDAENNLILRRDGAYQTLHAHGERIQEMIARHLDAAGIRHCIVGHPTLFDVVFTDANVRNYRDVLAADADNGLRFNAVLRDNGIFKSPGKIYPCLALTELDFALTDAAIQKATEALG